MRAKKIILMLSILVLTATGCSQKNNTSNFQQSTLSTNFTDTSSWKTYSNLQRGYAFRYPNDWTLVDKEPSSDSTSKLFSTTVTSVDKKYSFLVFSKYDKKFIDFTEEQKANVVIDGEVYQVSFLGTQLGCKELSNSPPDGECSSFNIPITRNNNYYDLQGRGVDIKNEISEPYKGIISSFKFMNN
jgi:hypothetical protein